MTTTWPDDDDLRTWLSQHAVSDIVDETLIPEVVADASAAIYSKIDPNKLPEDTDECPRTIARAIILEAARLLYRRQSPHGMAAFGEVAVRLRTVDVDVESLIHPYTMDLDP